MNIEYGKMQGILRWIRNPFTGTVTYFNDIHRKTNAFRRLTSPQAVVPAPPPLSPAEWRAEMARVTSTCVFCPGNEAMTMEEVLRVPYGDIYAPDALPASCPADAWAIRVVHNIIPRIPEECTGGKNESYVIMEDARHFLPGATSLSDLMWSGVLPAAHYYHVLRVTTEVVRRSLANPAVKSVLIRKHQGRESGASQPHIHIQAIGAERLFPDIEREMEVTARHPKIWHEIVDLMHEFTFDLEAGDGIVSYWSPFGKFPRQFEILSLQDWQPIHHIPEARLRLFSQYVHRLLRALGTAPHDLEIHHGEGMPLHLHLNIRRYAYANIGGTLNSPVDVAESVIPSTRDMVRLLAQEMATHTDGSTYHPWGALGG
jgi:galactose-1-phosphate uridylyltransferase